MTAADGSPRPAPGTADGFSAPTYHVHAAEPAGTRPPDQPTVRLDKAAASEPLHSPDGASTPERPSRTAGLRTAPEGTGDLTVTRAVLARGRYFSKLVAHKVIVASEADGARESGLTAMIWNQVMSYAADAMVTVALAGTVFFSATADAQRGNVLLYLLMTMAPFAVVAPVIGPALDRVQHGRRLVLAGTAIGRGVLAIVMAMNFTDLYVLFPAALGSLVLSKAYAVIRSAAAPRLVPTALTLVEANARLSLFGLVAAILGGGVVGFAIKVTGSYPLGLWITAAAFGYTAFDSFRLPKIVDALPPVAMPDAPPTRASAVPRRGERRRGGLWTRLLDWTRRGFAPAVIVSLQGESSLRWLSGFLTMFMAFHVEASAHGFQAVLDLGAVGAAAGVGNFAGNAIGTRLKLGRPELLILCSVAAGGIACLVSSAFFALLVAIIAVFVCMLGNSLSKLSLDAIIQRDVAETLRSSAFGRSETFLQLAWVLGAAVALLLPAKDGWLGFLVAAVVMLTVTGWMLVRSRALATAAGLAAGG
ncbi:MAG TPA: MFS transporter [Jatrophihabitans sp.]|nr:MFS transporter [Jatrophihabitans sp.]